MTALRIIDQLVIPTLVLFLLVGSLASAALGIGLLLRSEATLRFIASMNRWVSTRRVLRPLEVTRNVDTLVTARRRPWLGAAILAGSAIACYLLLTRLDALGARSTGVLELKSWLVRVLPLLVMKWFFALGCLFATACGVMLIAFPRTWRAFEERMNRWYSTRRLLPADGDQMRMPLEALVEARPRAAGAIIAAASLIVALAMAGLLALR